MQLLKRLLDFYINSSIHVAIAVCCLSCITLINFGFSLNEDVLLFTFFATVTGYNFVKYFGLAKFHHRRLAIWLKYIQVFSFFSFLGLCYFGYKLETKTMLYLIGLSMVTFLYAIPFLPKKYFLDKSKNLRAISGLKIYVIAFVWAVTTVIIPLVNENKTVDYDVVITLLQRFLFVLIVTLPFEIRDMQFDSLKLATIPQRIGVKQTKVIGLIIFILFCLIEFLNDDISQSKTVITFVIGVFTSCFLIFSKIKQSKYYSSFWVESIPIFWFILTLLFI